MSRISERAGSAKTDAQIEESSKRPVEISRPGLRVLVVDDDLDILELISFNLVEAGYLVSIAVTPHEALHKVGNIGPDLIVLDIGLPEMDGFEVCRRLRDKDSSREIPIIMLTARSQESDRVLGFELGANDYLTKPFSPRELVLRIRNLLSGHAPRAHDENQVRAGELCIDTERHAVTVAGEPISLTLTEFRLLATLAQQNGRVQSRERLLEVVWQGDKGVDPRTVDTHMARLRDKLGKASCLVDTVYGVGYRFVKA